MGYSYKCYSDTKDFMKKYVKGCRCRPWWYGGREKLKCSRKRGALSDKAGQI